MAVDKLVGNRLGLALEGILERFVPRGRRVPTLACLMSPARPADRDWPRHGTGRLRKRNRDAGRRQLPGLTALKQALHSLLLVLGGVVACEGFHASQDRT